MTDSLLDALVDICGPGFARPARSVDRIAGRQAAHVAVPATASAVADTLRLSDSFRVRGAGTKIDWGFPPADLDLIVDTGRLNGLWDHNEATAVVAAGTPVAAVQAALALRGQRLAVDPPSRGATIGGMLAVNESGPLRHRFGSPAAQTVSVDYVTASGAVESSDGEGGRPGIAEIDGVLTSAVLRLEPLPPARRFVGRTVETPAEVDELVSAVLAQDVSPSAIEVDLPGATGGVLALLLEGHESEVAGSADKIAGVWGGRSVVTSAAPSWWGQYPFQASSDVALRIAAQPRHLQAVAYSLRDAAGSAVAIRGSAGVGTVHAVLPSSLGVARVREILVALEQVLLARRGKLAVVSAPPELAVELPMADRRGLF
ncbi:glycolate oxidase [Actinoplanes sp. OR16]|uniref:FAD-binding oxidoreductase n=1 Tax=Actinoplanes sp. OR16 TaxID=946334 RepID=UPI000F708E46|nr:FAD-binding protein [Actinoplanes sp. OR16]BBH65624.1 glycolate oxidase [Actinoplanes sp. OR16]